MTQNVTVAWAAQPGDTRFSATVACDSATDANWQIRTDAAFQTEAVAAKFVTVDNLANVNAASIQIGNAPYSVRPFQRQTFAIPGNIQRVNVAPVLGIVTAVFYNYDPGVPDAIDFLAILRQVTIAPGAFCDDLTGWPNMTGNITPAPIGVPVDGTIIAVRAKSNQSGLILGTFNLNGTGALPVQWRGTNPLDQTIKAAQIFLIVKNGGVWQVIEPSFGRKMVNEQYTTDVGVSNANALVFTDMTVVPIPYATTGLGANSTIVVECSWVGFAAGSAAGDFATMRIIETNSGSVSDDYFYGGNAGAAGILSFNAPGFIRWQMANILAPFSFAHFKLQSKSNQATLFNSAPKQQWLIREIPN